LIEIDGKRLFFKGNLALLKRAKVAIVGSRRALGYAQEKAFALARAFSKRGYIVVSGGALGIDAAAHKGAGSANTIAILANGLDIYYPATNKELLKDIEKSGLLLSPYEEGVRPTRWSFIERNKIVVALADFVIIAQAEKRSGSMHSAKFALQKQKPIYVLPHRIGESEGTNELLKKGLAKAIYDVEEFADSFCKIKKDEDPFISYLKSAPTYEEAVRKYGAKIFEAELLGLIEVKGVKIFYKGD